MASSYECSALEELKLVRRINSSRMTRTAAWSKAYVGVTINAVDEQQVSNSQVCLKTAPTNSRIAFWITT
jgi:hypothetical protein